MVSGCNPMVSKVEKIIPARRKDYSSYDPIVTIDKKKILARSRDHSSCDPMISKNKNNIPASSRDYSIYDITVSKVEQNIPAKFRDYSSKPTKILPVYVKFFQNFSYESSISDINKLLKIRCCNCKINFAEVEEKVIVCCAKCHSELLYSCRLCNQLFAHFAKAWLHVSSKCKSFKDKNDIDPQAPSKNSGEFFQFFCFSL